MQILITQANAGTPAVREVAEGRTAIRLEAGERIEVRDPKTGKVPSGLRARRGGEEGRDLILENAGEVLEIEGFFDHASEGEEAVAVEVRLEDGETIEVTPSSAELMPASWNGATGPLMASLDGLPPYVLTAAQAQTGLDTASGGATAGAAAGGASFSPWWVLGGLALAGGIVAAADDDDDPAPSQPSPPPPPPAPTFSLEADADSVNEGGTVTFTLQTTNVEPGTEYTYKIEGVDADDVVGGQLSGTVKIDADGKAIIEVTLRADGKTETLETLTVSVAGETASVDVVDTSQAPEPTYHLEADAVSVDEGGTVTFTLQTTNVPQGTTFEYEISGVDADDVVGGKLKGTVTIGADGKATIQVPLKADQATEGLETLTVSVAGQTASVDVVDTSQQPTYVLTADLESVDEGGTVTFILQTTHVPQGTTFEYTIDGVSENDVVGGQLGGTAMVDANGRAIIRVTLKEDLRTEKLETLTLSVAGQTASVQVVDTSKTPAFVLTTGIDDIAGGDADDVIRGSATVNILGDGGRTFNAGDVIDGGDGRDTLHLELGSGVVAGQGVTVSNVETVRLSGVESAAATGAPTLTMEDFDGSVDRIEIDTMHDGVSIRQQQSLADISIRNTADDVDLHYANKIVSGEEDSLNVAVNGFQGGLNVDGRIEGIAISVEDEPDTGNPAAASAMSLSGAGITDLAVSGGLEGQGFVLDLADPDDEEQVNAKRELGATLNGEDFVGDLTLQYNGGEAFYAYGARFSVSLEPGESVTLTIDGVEYTLVNEDDEPKSSAEVAEKLAELLADAGYEVDSSSNADGDDLVSTLIIHGLTSEVAIDLTIGEEAVEFSNRFDFSDGDDEGDTWERIDGTENRYSQLTDVRLGDGDDDVVVETGDITVFDSVDLGAGDNSLTLEEGGVYGKVTFGDGDGTLVTTGEIGGEVSFGTGDSELEASRIAGKGSVSFAGGDNTVELTDNDDSLSDRASVTFNGDGANTLTVAGDIAGESTVTFAGDGDNELIASDIQGKASVSFGDGDNVVAVDDEIEDEASLSFGNGNNTLTFAELKGQASVSFGDGANEVTGDVMTGGSSLELGDGNNVVTFGDIRAETADDEDAAPSLTFGDGANKLAVEGDVQGASITLGDGGESGNIIAVGGAISGGATVASGAGGDTLLLGDGDVDATEPHAVHGADRATLVDLGAGDDEAVLEPGDVVGSGPDEDQFVIVGSGGFLAGGDGDDVLTVRAVDDVDVVARTKQQVVTVTFAGSYTKDEWVTVTIGEQEFSYQVKATDIVQGDAAATGANVAAGLLAVINADEDDPDTDDIDEDIEPLLTATGHPTSNVLTLTGPAGQADVEVTSNGGQVETVQIADAGISGFEEVNLVAVNPDDDPEDGNDDETDTAHIRADFSLLTGVEQLNLVSEVEVIEAVHGEGTNGEHVVRSAGNTAIFTLENLTTELSANISVSGREVTATGNYQVLQYEVKQDAGYTADDVIVFTITEASGEPVEYRLPITEALLDGETDAEDAANIAQALAALINAGDGSLTAHVDGNVLTLIGSTHENAGVEVDDGLDDKDGIVTLESHVHDATAADDEQVDVYIDASLAADEDGDNDTLELTIDGEGDFDIGLDAATYENLVLHVEDGYSHYINTDADEADDEFVGGSITLNGGAEDTSLVIDSVMAKTVTSNSAADVTVIFDEDADADAAGEDDYAFTVTTLGGDDSVDMAGVIMTGAATIDLGDGDDYDRLRISNGRHTADGVMPGTSDLDQDRMFAGVSGVEELRYAGGKDRDEVVFDDDARDAGFRHFVAEQDAELGLVIGDRFHRALTGELEEGVDIDLEIRNAFDVTFDAGNNVDATVTLVKDSAGTFTLNAGDDLTLDGDGDVAGVVSNGSDDIVVTAGERATITVEQAGSGDVSVTTGGNGSVLVNQGEDAAGAVSVATGASSEVEVNIANTESTADVTVTQTYADDNRITLTGLNAAQDITVGIDIGNATSAFIGDTTDPGTGTDLKVADSEGGIDTLVVGSLLDEDGEPVGATENVTVRIDDAWAVPSDGEDGDEWAADLVVDASGVVASNAVLVDGRQEESANLELVGAASSVNYLLGGAGEDRLVGGDAGNVLMGDSPVVTRLEELEVRFGHEDPIGYFDLTIGGVTIRSDTAAGSDIIYGPDLVDAWVALLNGELADKVVEDGGVYSAVWSSDGKLIQFWVDGGTEDFSDWTTPEDFFGPAVTGASRAGEGLSAYLVIEGSDFVYDSTDNLETTEVSRPVAASDVLVGGEGDDAFLFLESQLETVDTIVGLNLGGDGEDPADVIVLNFGGFDGLADGAEATADDLDGDVADFLSSAFSPDGRVDLSIVNNGETQDITSGNTLAEAISTLFEANGAFGASGSAETYAAGLFNWNEETYLVVVGGEAGFQFGEDDFVIQVTGYEGELDADDLIAYAGVSP